MNRPHRIQRRRTKGWRMPAGTVYVGRPSIFGNPFGGSPPDAVAAYREWLLSGLEGRPAHTGHYVGAVDAQAGYPWRTAILEALPRLRGKNLACWCPLSSPCHADVLLELANADPPRKRRPLSC